MRRRTIIATVAGLGIITALFAGKPMMENMHECREGMHKMHGKHHGQNPKELFKKIRTELDLDDTQKEKFKTIVSGQRDIMKAKFKKLKQEQKSGKSKRGMPDMSLFMSADKFDKEAFTKVMQTKQEKRQEMMKKRQSGMIAQRADTLEKIFAILTPQQRTKLIKLSKER